jgi:hypothetical protein
MIQSEKLYQLRVLKYEPCIVKFITNGQIDHWENHGFRGLEVPIFKPWWSEKGGSRKKRRSLQTELQGKTRCQKFTARDAKHAGEML